MSAAARLRLVQVACIVLVLGCVGFLYRRRNPPAVPMTTRHWIVTVAAIWSATSGFTFQRRIVHRPARPTKSYKSTPFTRWRAGNIVRLGTATSLGLWAVVLSDWGGPPWVINAFFVGALLLLLIWSPGPVPDDTRPS